MRQAPSGRLVGLRRVVAPAVASLRTYRGTAALLMAAAVAALAALLPVTSLVSSDDAGLAPRLRLIPWRGGSLGIHWTAFAWDPAATPPPALVMLFRLLAFLPAAGPSPPPPPVFSPPTPPPPPPP